MELRPADIEEILRIFAESDLEELHLEIAGTRLDLSKSGARGAAGRDALPARSASAGAGTAGAVTSAPVASQSAAATEPAASPVAPEATSVGQTSAAAPETAPVEDGLVELRSPLLGVFYRRPAPDQPAFVEPGSAVEPDDAVCIVDVMKMFTRVPAGVAGTVVEILAQDGSLVEHGQVLMRIRPR